MPKLLFAFFFMSIVMSSFAQIKKNDFLVGGQLSYNYFNSEENNLSHTSKFGTINIIAGKAIRENRVAGVLLRYSSDYSKNVGTYDTVKNRNNYYSIGGFYRAYSKIANVFYFFAELDGAYTFSSGTIEEINRSAMQKGKGGYLSITPGISYQMAKKLQLEIMLPGLISIQYLENKIEGKTASTEDAMTKVFTASTSLSNPNGLGFLGVGFKFIL